MISALSFMIADEQEVDMSKLIDDAGPVAGLFVLLLGIGIFFLWRSMSKQLKRIDPDLPAGRDDRLQARDRALTQEAVDQGEQAEPGAPAPDADEPSRT